MEIYKEGITGINAETTINLITKEVQFKYPAIEAGRNPQRQADIGYFNDSIAIALGNLIGVVLSVAFTFYVPVPNESNWQIEIYGLSIGFFLLFTPMYLTGMTSIFLNRTNKKIRENYPRRQKIIPRKWKEVKLPETNGAQYIHDNKLLLLDYDIARMEYEYEGDNKIIKIETKSIEPKDRKREHFNFIAIFTFENNIREGVFKYK